MTAAAEREEGLVYLGAAVVAYEQSLEVVQPGEGALDDPASGQHVRLQRADAFAK